MSTETLIVDAIRNKKQVTAYYDDHYREMCPHVIGYKSDKLQALFYQFGGESSSGLPPEGQWRCMEVDGLSQVDVVDGDGEWYTGESHTRLQTCVDLDQIIEEVDY